MGAEGAVVLDDFIPFDSDTGSGLTVGAGEIVSPGEPDDGTKDEWRIDAIAVCGTPPPFYSIISNTSIFIPTNKIDRVHLAVAQCSPTRLVIGGGASLSNGWGQASIRTMHVETTRVEAVAESDKDGFSEPWSVTAYAICAAPLPGWNVVLEESVYEPEVAKTRAALCPRDQKIIGASWRMYLMNEDGDSADRYITSAALSVAPDPGVTTTAVATESGSEPWKIWAGAVCID